MLFLCTANMTDTIPGPLLDRMEVVRLSGYVTGEKMEILRRYLYPAAMKGMGLKPEHMELKDEAALQLIRWYCREAGVRNLQKHIERICRKVALRVVRGGEGGGAPPVVVDESNLHEFVGKPQWTSDRIYGVATPPGVVMGLAWTSMGGTVLYVETVETGPRPGVDGEGAGGKGGRARGGGSLTTTGKMGEVMVESSRIAHTLAKRLLRRLDPGNDVLDTAQLHMHVPEGATPKDGPSAGCTMVTSLLSLAMDKAVRPDLAMTGEVSLTGIVLPIGGVKEKTVAAQRAGIKHMILPEANRRDFLELPEQLREGITVHYAATYDDIFKVAFSYDEDAGAQQGEGASRSSEAALN